MYPPIDSKAPPVLGKPGHAAPRARLADYIRIMRPDHWVKNVFMLPGAAIALLLKHESPLGFLLPLALAAAAVCLLSSANYVINEFLDAEFDRHHPIKQFRPSALGLIDGRAVFLEYLALAAVGLAIAARIDALFAVASTMLLVMGVLYNVPPIRTKDRVYLDVISESVNNPLRFVMGWAVVIPATLPPSSVLLAYWFGGAFLMAVKRFSEYRGIGNPAVAAAYRRSFKYYDESKLLLSSVFYGLNSAFFLGVFLIKYRVEFLLSFPLFAVLFTWYLAIGFKAESAAQNPERLFEEHAFMLFAAFLAVAVVALFVVDIPAMHMLMQRIEP
jgi:4-hydroxybenzoate polyprenyltransferase